MKVILSPNPYRDRGLRAAQSAAKVLRASGVEVCYCLPFEPDPRLELPQQITYSKLEDVVDGADFIICFGGDGTLLHGAKAAYQHDIPIMGVNMGTVGFMAELEHGELSRLSRLAAGNYKIEARMMLDVSVTRDGKEIYRDTALNDAAVTKGAVARVTEMSIYANKTMITAFSGDGVVVATPTGSTAYSLSAGGPVVEPTARNFIITPICAHSLNAKSFVLSTQHEVEVKLGRVSRNAAFLSVDGGKAVKLASGDTVRLRRAKKSVRLLSLSDRSFYELLLTKLGKA